MRKKTGIDWKKSPCCGARVVEHARLPVCSRCERPVERDWGGHAALERAGFQGVGSVGGYRRETKTEDHGR